MRRLRSLAVCVLVPAGEPGTRTAFFIAKGQVVCARPVVGAGVLELRAGLAAVEHAQVSLAPEAADELLVIDTFLRRPPPELVVRPLAGLAEWPAAAR